MLKLLPLADILKLSEEELTLLTGETGLDTGTAALAVQGPALILISLAERGAYFRRGALCGLVPAFQVDTVDTTGAGDAFWGGMLSQMRFRGVTRAEQLTEPLVQEALEYGNVSGWLCVQGRGAIPSLPTRQEIERYLV